MMFATLSDLYERGTKWCNENQGIVSIGIFATTLLFGWVSGIFSALRRRPKFKITSIGGPTFCCTYVIGKRLGDYEIHRTGIALYLRVTNIGSAASSIQSISVGYHWQIRPFSLQWLRYSIGWFWITEETVALSDFQVKIGENIKVYPFLTQKSALFLGDSNTYLGIGQSINGVVYFEQDDSWGGCYPAVRAGRAKLKVCMRDAFGADHTAKISVPVKSLEEARRYNPDFGKTLAELRGEPLPHDKFETDFKQAVASKNPQSIEDAVDTAVDVAKHFLPYGVPYPGKPNLVIPPWPPFRAVNVEGFASGTEVKDPYTGKIFLVP
jgi:hypothetical protein